MTPAKNVDMENGLPLTPAVFHILFALSDGDKHGYAIMQQVAALSGRKFRMGPGTLYTAIQRLLEAAWIEERERKEEADSRRRYYRLTNAGRRALQAEVGRMDSILRLAQKRKLVPRLAE